MKKVLLYSHYFSPAVGGAERFVELLASGLVREGHHVVVATATPPSKVVSTAFPFRVVRQPGAAALWRLIRSSDMVQLAGPAFLPLMLALLQRKPVVVEHHGYQAVCPNGLLLYEPTKAVCPGHFVARRYHKCLRCNAAERGWLGSVRLLLAAFPRRWMCRRVAANAPISAHVDKRLGLPRSRVIYYGVPDGRTRAANSSGCSAAAANLEQAGRRADSPGGRSDVPEAGSRRPRQFGYVGRLVSEKGLPLLLLAGQRLHQEGLEFHLFFIGDGPERPALEELTDRLGLRDRVTFTGFLQGESLDRALFDLDAVVMPSIWEETAGLAAMEHMMRGRPVIAADIGGLGEVVGEAGLMFPPADVGGLTRRLRQIVEGRVLVDELGRSARERALRVFGQQRMVGEYAALYHLLREKSSLT
ncbi:MAG: glycosyltransferase family 4 protein [Gemmatimonadetes bacterium]|nr:glycosyltransferase family 4 protein [Gemmatimonadota bacterium]